MSEAAIGLFIFTTAAGLAYLLTPMLRRRALASGHLDAPGGRKNQTAPVPYGGGRAVFYAFALTVILGLAAALTLLGGLEAVGRHHEGLLRRALPLVKIVFGAGVMLWMGRLDDRRSLSPGLRLLIQICAALPLATDAGRLTLFIEQPGLQVALALLWLVFITNAANFIDNMDGLLAGTALIATTAFAALAALLGQLFVAAFALALAGSICGVLPHNRRPARIYLGDEGSMFIGFLLGALAMVTSYRGPGESAVLPFVVPLLILVVPTLDAAVAIGGRLRRGQAPWTAGHDHLSHRLIARGFSPRAAVRLLQGLGALGAALAFLLYRERAGGPVALAAFLVLALVRIGAALRRKSCD